MTEKWGIIIYKLPKKKSIQFSFDFSRIVVYNKTRCLIVRHFYGEKYDLYKMWS